MANTPVDPAPGLSPFDDPLKHWGNDDLLLTPDRQRHFQEFHPQVWRILDWPQMRETFLQFNKAANLGKRRSRSIGFVAVILAGSGVILGALASLSGTALATISGFSALLTFLGGVLAIWHVLGSRSRMLWLSNRYWTERIRQFHFQFLVNNLELAARGMRDDDALRSFIEMRERAFNDMLTSAKYPSERIAALEQDLGDEGTWLEPNWGEPSRRPMVSDELNSLLEALYHLRIRVQSHYTRLSLLETVHSPKVRAAVFQWVGDVCTVLVVLLAFCAGLAFGPMSDWLRDLQSAFVAGVGVFSAVGLMTRALEQGLQTAIDQERYEWYLASVNAVETSFVGSNTQSKIEAIRRLEELSYRELRRFIISHHRAKFLM